MWKLTFRREWTKLTRVIDCEIRKPLARLDYIKILWHRLLRWEKRVILGKEEWEIPLGRGRAHFENMFNKHVTVVERDKLFHPTVAGLNYGVWGNLDSDRVALLVRPNLHTVVQWAFDRSRSYMFLGEFKKSNSGLTIHGVYRTHGWFRQYALGFVNTGLLFFVLSVLVLLRLLVETISEGGPPIFILAMIGATIIFLLLVLAFTVSQLWFFRLLFGYRRLGTRSNSEEVHRLLLYFAGTEN